MTISIKSESSTKNVSPFIKDGDVEILFWIQSANDHEDCKIINKYLHSYEMSFR